MLKKKHVVAIVSIALICFLIGTSMAKDGGNPFEKIWEAIYGLESRVEALENQSPLQGFTSAPAYDSGWVSIPEEGEETVFTHNLNTMEVFVYLIGKDVDQVFRIHQLEYGGWGYWHKLDSNNISVTAYYPWDNVRVMIWRIPDPAD